MDEQKRASVKSMSYNPHAHNWNAVKKVIRYARYELLQRMFWSLSSKGHVKMPEFILTRLETSLHDCPPYDYSWERGKGNNK